MFFRKKITPERAIEIAKRNKNMPQAIHIKIIRNFEEDGKVGILSYIELESPVVKEVTIDSVEYYEVVFTKGDISYQQLSDDRKDVDIFFDGMIEDDGLAKGLVNKKTGKFTYTGICDIRSRD